MQALTGELARSALDAAPDALIIVDGEGTVRFANRQASVLFGYPHEEIVDLAVERLIPERYRERHVEHREDFARNGRLRPMGVGMSLFARRKETGGALTLAAHRVFDASVRSTVSR